MKNLLFLIVLFVSCRKDDGFIQYTIKKGKHYSLHTPGTLKSDTLRFQARFSRSCLSQLKDSIDKFDINKLYGFSECNDRHHENSARLGWRSNGKYIEIFAYVYNKGVRTTWFLTLVEVDVIYDYFIIITDSNYLIGCNDRWQIFSRTNKCNLGIYYKLYPYFGGNKPAPSSMSIFIKEL